MSLPSRLLETIKLFRAQLALFPAFVGVVVIARVKEEGEGNIQARPPVPSGVAHWLHCGLYLHRGLRDLVTSGEGQLLRLRHLVSDYLIICLQEPMS